MSAPRAPRGIHRVLAAALVLGSAPGAPADSTADRVQLGVGMGAVGALVGAAAGSQGALIGGVVGMGIGVSMAGDPQYDQPVDPEHARAIEAERAGWAAQRQASEENLRNEQRRAFEERMLAQQGAGGAAPSAPITGQSVLGQARPGASSALVQQIQRSLMRKGYQPGAADGVLSPATVAAIQTYQSDHRLPSTGEPSKSLLEHLRREGG